MSVVERFEDIQKPDQDDREYRHITLTNGLCATLVRDPSAEKSAAALDVKVGQFSDPKHVPGLAHFLEHMLFLGTKKYPNESDYQNFVAGHGGYTNAFTSAEDTQYYFEIKQDYLEPALDRFAQFFIAPLFTPSATSREMNAVESEHQKNLQTDGRRFYQVMKQLTNPQHPVSTFGSGNLASLNIPGILDDLVQFHERYYSANVMKLCVVGRESLDQLEEMVVQKFSEVPNKQVTRPDWPEPIFRPQDMKRSVKIVPVKNSQRLELLWSLPPQQPNWRAKPSRYISHTLGHEGPGSLLSYLKAKGWVDELGAGATHTNWSSGAMFTSTCQLTLEGRNHVDEIIEAHYSYLKIIRDSDLPKWIYDELVAVSELSFRFRDKSEPGDLAGRIASAMQEHAPAHILSGDSLFWEFRPDLIREILSMMVPDNMQIHYASSHFAAEATNWAEEKYYGVKHKIEPFESSSLTSWQNPTDLHGAVRLPDPNPFIASDLSLKPLQTEPSTVPQLVQETPNKRVWHVQDRTFNKPKAHFAARLNTVVAYKSPAHCVRTKLLAMLVNDALNEFAYDAEVAGLEYKLYNIQYGLQMSVTGWDHKLAVLLRRYLETIAHFKIDSERFAIIKDKMIRELDNLRKDQSYQQCIYNQGVFFDRVRWHYELQLTAAKDISIVELESHMRELLSSFHVETLVFGNATPEDAIEWSGMIDEILRPSPSSVLFAPQVTNLEKGMSLVHQELCSDPDNENNAITLSFIGDQYQPEPAVKLDLIQKIASEPLFTQLRTQEQLGYIVNVHVRRLQACVDTLEFLIQSPIRDPVYLHQRLLDWLTYYEELLVSMDDATFQGFVDALIAQRLDKPKSMTKEVNRIWFEIAEKSYLFDRREIEVNVLRRITKQDVIDYYRQVVTSSEARRIAFHVFGNKHPVRALSSFDVSEVPAGVAEAQAVRVTSIQSQLVTDISAFKDSWSAYYLSPPPPVLRASM